MFLSVCLFVCLFVCFSFSLCFIVTVCIYLAVSLSIVLFLRFFLCLIKLCLSSRLFSHLCLFVFSLSLLFKFVELGFLYSYLAMDYKNIVSPIFWFVYLRSIVMLLSGVLCGPFIFFLQFWKCFCLSISYLSLPSCAFTILVHFCFCLFVAPVTSVSQSPE